MTDHDPLCLYQDDGYGASCEICRVIAEARADEREKIATAWQLGGWTEMTESVRARSVIGAAQVVTDWLRARSGGSDE